MQYTKLKPLGNKGVSKMAIVVVLVAVVAVVGVVAFMGLPEGAFSKKTSETGDSAVSASGSTVAAKLAGVKEPTNGKRIPRLDIEFDMVAGDAAAQDAEADQDIDVFKFSFDKNAALVDKNLVDCTGAKPAVFNGEQLTVDVVEQNFCKVNTYRLWRDSNYNGGNLETTEIRDVLGASVASDLDDIDGSGTKEFRGDASQMYIVFLVEAATGDDEDIVPQAFLIGSTATTTQSTEEFANGAINVRWSATYRSDAAASTTSANTKVYGDCTDDTTARLNTNLPTALSGMVDTSLTTLDTVKYNCNLYLEVTKDGHSLALVNPLASSDTERAYIKFIPYGANSSANATADAAVALHSNGGYGWVKYGTLGLTGDVAYSTSANNSIIWESSQACGVSLTQNSPSDAVVRGNENLYEPSCFKDSSTVKNGITGLHDKGAKLRIPLTITEVQVDADRADEGGDAVLSTDTRVFEISLVTMESATDRFSKNLTA